MSSESRTEETKPVAGGVDLRLRVMNRLSNPARNSLWVLLSVGGAMLVGLALYLYQAFEINVWQIYVLAGLTGGMMVISLAGALMAWRGRTTTAVWMVLVGLQVLMGFSPLLVGGLGLWYAIGIFMATLIITSLCMHPLRTRLPNLLGAAVGSMALLLNEFATKYQVTTGQFFENIVFSGVMVVAAFYLLILIIYFPSYSLRTKISITIFAAVILSIGMLSSFNNISSRRALIDAANKTLMLAAKETAQEIDEYFLGLMDRVETQATAPLLKIFFTLTPEERAINPTAQTYLYAQSVLVGAQYYAVIDRYGSVLLHTVEGDASLIPSFLGMPEGVRIALREALSSGAVYISPLIFPAEGGTPSYIVSSRIQNAAGTPIGMLVASFSPEELQSIVMAANDTADIGSYAILLDENHLRIVHGRDAQTQYRLLIPPSQSEYERLVNSMRVPNLSYGVIATNLQDFDQGLERIDETPFFTTEDSYSGAVDNSVAATKLETRYWTLAFLQSQAQILEPVATQTRINILIAVAVTGLSILAASLLARVLANPIVRLTSIAERAAGGNLYLQASTQSPDEIGALGLAFNSMINQLRQTLEGLETRVAERTAELMTTSSQMEYRANRLQVVAEIAHAISAVQDPGELLPRVTQEISARYGYYHVGVFLVDAEKVYAVLQAANSAGGERMLARSHRLRIGEVGIVGYVAGVGQARIALDVGQDAVFFDNPDLPETRSEIALPLKVGTEVIGVLDVQSTEAGAFSQDDIALLSALADQVAMAIQNTHLNDETRRTLRELQIAQRQYLQDVWGKHVAERPTSGFEVAFGRVSPLSGGSGTTELVSVGVEGMQVRTDEKGNMVIPIILRGQVIGVIDLQEAEPGRLWSREEIEVAQGVADQVGLALENARLLEETQRRAERERMVADITTKMRATNDPQVILETAIAELRNALRVKKVHVRLQKDEANPSGSIRPGDGSGVQAQEE